MHSENRTTSPPAGALQAAASPAPARLRMVFIGNSGLRAGWRLLIYFGILAAIFSALGAILHLFHRDDVFRPGSGGMLIPWGVVRAEIISIAVIVIATWIMARIEGRKFGEYGLPLDRTLRKDFWVGTLWGFGTISGTLLAIFALHGFRVSSLAIHGSTILESLAAWSVAFVLVGIAEEFSFRGYVQFTLTTGIGFWPAAILMSLLFGFAHRGNSGENYFGLSSVVLFGLLFCLILRRRGDLWWAVGFHAGYDWGQTFFYGVPDSGMLPYHNLLVSSFSGPAWLTGGSVGPEASVFTPVVLLITGLLFSRVYREIRYRPASPARTRA